MSRRVTTAPEGPPSRSVGRWLTASSRPRAANTSSVALRPRVSSAARSGPMPVADTGRPSASGGRSSSLRASSLARTSRPSPSRISTPSRTACSTASWCSYIRVISAGSSPCVCCRSRRLTRPVPSTDRPSAAPVAPSSRGTWPFAVSLTRSRVIPAETSPTTLPSGPVTGTTARVDGPSVPVTVSRTVPPSAAGPIVPM